MNCQRSADPLTLKTAVRARLSSRPALAKAAGCASGLLLGHIDDPGLSIFLQASVAQFGSDGGLLVAPEGNVGLQVEMPVDPDRARIDLRGYGEGRIVADAAISICRSQFRPPSLILRLLALVPATIISKERP
jgi:hypothetical protein